MQNNGISETLFSPKTNQGETPNIAFKMSDYSMFEHWTQNDGCGYGYVGLTN